MLGDEVADEDEVVLGDCSVSVAAAGLVVHAKESFVVQASLLNRPLRTRMVGGVGAGG